MTTIVPNRQRNWRMPAWAAAAVLAAAVWAAEPSPWPGMNNLHLAEHDGKLRGSFTYRLVVGHFYEWNADPTAFPGILHELNQRTGINARVEFKAVGLADPQLIRNPFVMMTGNRAFKLTEDEVTNLQLYVELGGIIYVDDCGGTDWSVRRMFKQILPDGELKEVGAEHPLFRTPHKLTAVPKVVDLYHGPAKCFGIEHHGRLAAIYTHDTDLPCSWERYPDGSFVHVIAPAKRDAAARFGVNVLVYALRQHLDRAPPPTSTTLPGTLPDPVRLPATAIDNYPMKRQLPCHCIRAMAADQTAVWFGGFTLLPGEDEGLGRYDKRTGQWRVFMDAEGVLNEEINCLALHDKNVLVGGDTWKWSKGMAVFEPAAGRWRTLAAEHGPPHDRVVGIARDGDDLWIACRQGAGRLRRGAERVEKVQGPGLPDQGLFSIGIMADARYVWLNHFTGVARLDKRTGRWRPVADLTPLVPSFALDMATGPGSSWLLPSLENGTRLIHFNQQQGRFSEWAYAKDVDLTRGVSVAADDREVFVGTQDDGIWAFPLPSGKPTHYGMPDPLPTGKVYRLLADGNHLWASILPYAGLWRLDRERQTWEPIPHRTGTPASHVLCLTAYDNRLYLGTIGAGPWAYEPGRKRWRNLNLDPRREGKPYPYTGEHSRIRWDSIYCFLTHESGLWMGTNHGLLRHDSAETPNGFHIIGPQGMVCTGLAVQKNILWAASASGRISAYDLASSEWREEQAWQVPAAIRGLTIWRNAWYVASANGLYRRGMQETESTLVSADLLSGDVSGVWADAGNLFVAAATGLYRIGEPTAKPVQIATSKHWGHIHSLQAVGPTLLVGTTMGLFVCDSTGGRCDWINRSSGLKCDDVAAVAVLGNNVWLGTLGGGLTRIRAEVLESFRVGTD